MSLSVSVQESRDCYFCHKVHMETGLYSISIPSNQVPFYQMSSLNTRAVHAQGEGCKGSKIRLTVNMFQHMSALKLNLCRTHCILNEPLVLRFHVM